MCTFDLSHHWLSLSVILEPQRHTVDPIPASHRRKVTDWQSLLLNYGFTGSCLKSAYDKTVRQRGETNKFGIRVKFWRKKTNFLPKFCCRLHCYTFLEHVRGFSRRVERSLNW